MTRSSSSRWDVTDESAAASAVKAAIGAFGSLEAVINNAGYGNLSSVEDTPMSDFRAQIETNLFGTIIVTKGRSSVLSPKESRSFCSVFVDGRKDWASRAWARIRLRNGGVEGFSEVLSRWKWRC